MGIFRYTGKLILQLVLVSFALALFSDADASQKKRVLILNSYHQGYKWTDDEIRGIMAGLESSRKDVAFYIEYMGAKWVGDRQFFEHLGEAYRHKFRKNEFDVIVATDNDAFDFLRLRRDEIFGRVPVVFCGVNWFRDEDVRGIPMFTGINEDADIRATLEVMLKLHPGTKHIYFVNDATTTGRIVHGKMQEIIPDYRYRVAFHFLEGMKMGEMLRAVANAPPDSLVLLSVFQQDAAGAYYEYSDSTEMISKSSRVPVYGLWDFNLGFGIAGGMLTSGYTQGNSAGTLARRILRGESPNSIPIVRKSPNRFMFDYRQLQRFNIRQANLPGGSVVVNQPTANYEVHEGLVWGVVSGMTLLATISGFLGLNILRRRRAEEALRASEECFRTIFDSVNDAIFIMDPADGTILDVNRKMCEMYGYTREQACSVSVAELSANEPPYSMLEAREWIGKTAGEKPQLFEWLARDKGGRLFWVEVNMRRAVINNRERLLVTVRDIDKRKHSEERLAKLNRCFLGFGADPLQNIIALTAICGELLGATFALYNRLDGGLLHALGQWNAPPDFKLTDTAEGHICPDVIKAGGDRLTFIPNLAQTVYAVSDSNVKRFDLRTYIGMPVRCNDIYVGALCVVYQQDFIPDEEEKKLVGILAGAIGVEEERRLAADQLRSAHYELETRVVERTVELARANEQLLIDIGERKRAEEALWKSESLLRKLFEAIPDMLSVVDSELRIIHSNWQGGYEYGLEEYRRGTAHCYNAYYPEQGRPCEPCHALEVFRTGQPVYYEKENSRIGTVEVRAYPVFDDMGRVVMVAEHVRDITERKRLEEEMVKAQKLESLGVLAGGIAHDFNNLLTGILGNISLAKFLMNPADKAYPKLSAAEMAAARASDLTQQLLTFSKGGSPLRKTAEIIQIVKDSASFMLRGSNVRCEFSIPDQVWPVEVDEGQMNQVINNLIINADQAMPEGGIIRIGIENRTVGPEGIVPLVEGRYVLITITDQGVGIPEELQQKIFDPYFTTKQNGSGLGLATVYSIIRNHDGYIRVESREGSGTTFFIYLPASAKPLPQQKEPAEKCQTGAGRILVMDDEELVRNVAVEMLSHLGYSVDLCSDGGEALQLYQTALQGGEAFFAVIMDLTVPGGMGGKEAMRKLLEIDAEAVGIVSSGYCNDPVLANYREYGFREVAAKPYNIQELGRILHQLRFNGDALQD